MSFNIIKRLAKADRLFLGVVVVPVAISILYFGLLASDVYISESSFVIYSQQTQQSTGLSSFLQTAGLSNSSSGVYAVRDYILSRDALATLEKDIDVRKIYTNHDADLFNRFGGMFWPDRSNEKLLDYYRHMIGEDIDSTSNITTLRTKAYTAEDAQRINSELLAQSQELVNRLNERANKDAVRFFEQSVTDAKSKAQQASVNLAEFRNKRGVFSPEPQVTLKAQLISKLQDDLIVNETKLHQLESISPQNPQIAALKIENATLQNQIQKQMGEITGGNSSLASNAVEYEKLSLDKDFAEKELAVSLSSLEQARIQAQKQQMFLESISTPSLPDEALEPRRIRGVLSTLMVGLLLWGVFSVIFAGIREHNDR
ncbi:MULTISPECIES: hypothetical protein [Burkholderiaceae]|uniref:hypothetical protein n=1 Tax=Burkholderiaceae TaxID=119060 RepID=UPI00141E5C3C|nr:MULTISPECIES: hypothetical protein [Burkholderiaceae]MBN3849912.1 hypothetical protein [Paraburkholderia sp. Ac-20342]NIF56128.1 hypothetical protein [Burkholderia sp. Ax-1724]